MQGCILIPKLFNTFIDFVVGEMVGKTDLRMLLEDTRFTGIDLADSLWFFSETLEVLVLALD